MIDKFTDGNDWLYSFASNNPYVILTSITNKYVDLCYNWFLSLKQLNLDKFALVVALDKTSYRKLQNLGVPSVLLQYKIPNHFSSKQWVEIEKETKLLSLHFIYKNFPIDVILSDIDIVFFKNPYERFIDLLKTNWYHVIAMSDKVFQPFHLNRIHGKEIVLTDDFGQTNDYGFFPQHLLDYQVNAGFSFLPNTNSCTSYKYDSYEIRSFILNFISVFYKNSSYLDLFPKQNESGCLQVISNKRYIETQTKVGVISTFDFVNGSLWKVPYLKNYVKDKCYLVHYNFSKFLNPNLALKDKISQIKKDGFWFL